MSDNNPYDLDIDVSGIAAEAYPVDTEMLGTNEYGTDEVLGVNFMGPCLGIMGYDDDDDLFHAAHKVAPTPQKVEDFLNRYEPDAVVVTGLNYTAEQLEEHNELPGGPLVESEPVQETPEEAYRVMADGGYGMRDLSDFEEIMFKRGAIENQLDEADIPQAVEWAPGPNKTSLMTASAPEKEIKVLHSNLSRD